jgi:hypothetical protein
MGFDAEAPDTVLQAAERAGVRLPSSCRNGTCRTCICQSSGTVRYKIDWPGLSPMKSARATSCRAWPSPPPTCDRRPRRQPHSAVRRVGKAVADAPISAA